MYIYTGFTSTLEMLLVDVFFYLLNTHSFYYIRLSSCDLKFRTFESIIKDGGGRNGRSIIA